MQAQSVMSFHGTRGVFIHGGNDIRNISGLVAVGGSMALTSENSYLTINEPSPQYSARLKIKSSQAIDPTVFHEGAPNSPFVWERWKNSNNDDGYIAYDNTNFDFYTNDIKAFSITPTGAFLYKAPKSTSSKVLVRNSDNSIGEREFPSGAFKASTGVSQANFDSAIAKLQSNFSNGLSNRDGVSQAAFDALLNKVNSLETLLVKQVIKEDLKIMSVALAALAVKVNNFSAADYALPNLQLTQIITELKKLIYKNEVAMP